MFKTISIVKIGGALLEDMNLRKQSLQAVANLSGAKILVHGGGRTATDLLTKLNMPPTMINGRRVTDDKTIEIVRMVYAGVNKELVATLQAMRVNAIGLCGADEDCLRATIRPKEPIDFGWVGDLTKASVNMAVFTGYVEHHIMPVVAPLTHDGEGNLLNTNADTIATVISQALATDYKVRLIYLFEKAGVLADADDESSLIETLSLAEYERLKHEGKVHSGMIPKLKNGFDALANGVSEVVVCRYDALPDLRIKTSLVL